MEHFENAQCPLALSDKHFRSNDGLRLASVGARSVNSTRAANLTVWFEFRAY
jgi:hypothetical protein